MTTGRNFMRVQTGALILMIVVAAEMIRYLITSLNRALNFSFWEPRMWNTHHLVDPNTVVEMGPRIGYFTVWSTVILLSTLAFLAALQLLNNVRRGKIYHPKTAAYVSRLGLILAIAMIADQIFHSIDSWLLTRSNSEPLGIHWGYDPSDIKTLIMATILFLFGWVMRQGIEIDRENSEFV